MKCCFCGRIITLRTSNNVDPIKIKGENNRCCYDCNINIVIPTRINMLNIVNMSKNLK